MNCSGPMASSAPRGRRRSRSPGIDDRPVELVRQDDLAVLAGAVPRDAFSSEALQHRLEDLDELEALARAHDACLQRRSPPPTSSRSGSARSTSAASHRQMLARDGDHFRSDAGAAARHDGVGRQGVPRRRRPPPKSRSQRPASGTDYLSRKREHRDGRRGTSDAAEAAIAGSTRRSRSGLRRRCSHRRRTGGSPGARRDAPQRLLPGPARERREASPARRRRSRGSGTTGSSSRSRGRGRRTTSSRARRDVHAGGHRTAARGRARRPRRPAAGRRRGDRRRRHVVDRRRRSGLCRAAGVDHVGRDGRRARAVAAAGSRDAVP